MCFGETMGGLLGPFNVPFWAFKPAVWSQVRLCIPLWCLHCWTDPKHDLELSQISQTNSVACLTCLCPHCLHFFIDLHGERGKKEGETGLALKSPRKKGRQEKPALQVKIQATEALSQWLGVTIQGPLFRPMSLDHQFLYWIPRPEEELKDSQSFFLSSMHNRRRLHIYSVFFSRVCPIPNGPSCHNPSHRNPKPTFLLD